MAFVDKHGIEIDRLPGARSEVLGECVVGYFLKESFNVYNEGEFMDANKGVTMGSVGLEPNVQVTNNLGQAESLLAIRDAKPRRLVTYSSLSTKMLMNRMSQHVRPNQPEDTFAHEVELELEGVPYKHDKKTGLCSGLLTAAQVTGRVTKYLKDLEDKEKIGDDAAERGEESDDSVPPANLPGRFFRGSRGSAGSAKTDATQEQAPRLQKKRRKNSIGAVPENKRVQAAAAAPAPRSGPTSGALSASSLMADLARRLPATVTVAAGGLAVAAGGSVASLSKIGGGAASTVAGLDNPESIPHYFNFAAILTGDGDRNLLNGVRARALLSGRHKTPQFW